MATRKKTRRAEKGSDLPPKPLQRRRRRLSPEDIKAIVDWIAGRQTFPAQFKKALSEPDASVGDPG